METKMTTGDAIEKIQRLEIDRPELLIITLKPGTSKESEKAIGDSILEAVNVYGFKVSVLTDSTDLIKDYLIVRKKK